MTSLQLGVFVGSLRKDSYNLRLSHALERMLPPDVTFQHVRIHDLPLYNQDFDEAYPPE